MVPKVAVYARALQMLSVACRPVYPYHLGNMNALITNNMINKLRNHTLAFDHIQNPENKLPQSALISFAVGVDANDVLYGSDPAFIAACSDLSSSVLSAAIKSIQVQSTSSLHSYTGWSTWSDSWVGLTWIFEVPLSCQPALHSHFCQFPISPSNARQDRC